MNRKISPERFLSIWEQFWGVLTAEWRENFLKDARTKKILDFPESSIQLAILNNKKLDDIIAYLVEFSPLFVETTRQTQSKVVKNTDQKKSLKRNLTSNFQEISEYSDIHDWLKKFSVAKLNPENTFPRLIIKSDQETCENKITYNIEKDAILALIRLGDRKGELVKQLPYKCNVCHKFHNTHLISRETIQKLLSKYGRLKKEG